MTNGNVMNIDEIRHKLAKIKSGGYVQSRRRGPTGIGFTLETLLQISENNISTPDFGEIELKAQRENHKGMVTLFTFNKHAWKMKPLDAVRKYGSRDPSGRLGLYYTLDLAPNNAGLFLAVGTKSIVVKSTDGSLIAEWPLDEIVTRFNNKVKNILLVKAKVEIQNGDEYFLYDRAKLLSGGITKSIVRKQFRNGQLKLDLRLHDRGTMARNHGTGFRVEEKNLERFYTTVQEIAF